MANKKLPDGKKKMQLQVGIEKYKLDLITVDIAQERCKEHLDKLYKKQLKNG